MNLPDEVWVLVRSRAEGMRFGSITISFNEQSGAISLQTKTDERVLTNGKTRDSLSPTES